MKTVIAYPIPFDGWTIFKPFVERFVDTFRKVIKGADCEVMPVCNWGEPTDEVREMFRDIKTRFLYYYGNGCDVGSWQHAAGFCELFPNPVFLVCMTTRSYFHMDGWLYRLVFEREKYGPGLYTTSASHEGGTLHPCLRAFGVDAEDMRAYPVKHESREFGTEFEAHCHFANWLESERKRAVRLVSSAGCYDRPDWFTIPNRFRTGDQSGVIIWDKHTDLWRDAGPEEKERLTKMSEGTT